MRLSEMKFHTPLFSRIFLMMRMRFLRAIVASMQWVSRGRTSLLAPSDRFVPFLSLPSVCSYFFGWFLVRACHSHSFLLDILYKRRKADALAQFLHDSWILDGCGI